METMLIIGVLVAALWAYSSIKREEAEVGAAEKKRQKQRLLQVKEAIKVKKTPTPINCWHCKKITTNPDDCEHCGADSAVNGYFGYTKLPLRDYRQIEADEREADAIEGMAAHQDYINNQDYYSEDSDYDDHT
jgi:hypothetical protein